MLRKAFKDALGGVSHVARVVLCFANGHNVDRAAMPVGWSKQLCRTCGKTIEGFRRRPPEERK